MNDLYSEASMEDSYIYKTFNASSGVVERIIKYLKTGVILDKTYLEASFTILNKTHISPLYNKVIEAYENGDIELIYSREVKIGTSIPYIVRKNNGKIVATIFISSYAILNKEGTSLNIEPKSLYVLMESAFIALELRKPANKIQRSISLMKLTNSVYTSMVLRVLSKDYALSLDKSLYNKVSFSVSKFYLQKVWGNMNDELCTNYAINNCLNPDKNELDEVNFMYNDTEITSLDSLINFVKKLAPRMEGLTTRYFIERYINSYHGASVMSVDYLPYLFFVIENALIGTFLINRNSINDIIKNTKGMNAFYSELSKLL